MSRTSLNLYRLQRNALAAIGVVERLHEDQEGIDSVYSLHTLALQRLWLEIAGNLDEYRRLMGLPADRQPFGAVIDFAGYASTTSLADLNATRIWIESFSTIAQLRAFVEAWDATD